MLNNITVIIPIFNEEKNIGELINEINFYYSGINILIVDDFSIDNSVGVVKQIIKNNNFISTNILTKNKAVVKGLTNSIIYGINKVTTPYFLVMDGDFQHPVNNIKNFIEFFENGTDIVIGERDKIIFEEKKYRIYISKLGNLIINLKLKNTGLSFKDPLSGFFGGKTQIYNHIIKNNEKIFLGRGYKFLFEFLKNINKGDYLIERFNFHFAKRKFGESKITLIIFIEFIKGLLK